MKYNIYARLMHMSKCDYEHARKFLPNKLGIAPTTFYQYCNIRQNEHRAIPHHCLALLADFFRVQVKELINQTDSIDIVSEFEQYKELSPKYQQQQLKFPL
jgi:hypothetical protein